MGQARDLLLRLTLTLLASTQTALAQGTDSEELGEPEQAERKEISSSWALLILIVLLIGAFFTSYVLQSKRIQAVHETVISIFAGMVIGLVLRLVGVESVLSSVSFDYQFFFNLLLPPIILAAGYELHQGNFFRNIGTILTFAFAGTFISALVLGVVLYVWTRIPLEGLNVDFVDCMSVGATLSATDPVTILAIFNTYKVDPKLYTIIFGESILNDAIAIVLFQTAQKYNRDRFGEDMGTLTPFSFFESIGIFLMVFFGSLIIGVFIGLGTSLLLKLTHVRREPKIESCLILLIAYASYFFANAIHMSGIVSLLFCGICLKHYAYHNMSRRTQLTTKFTFNVLAQLSENFIFIYLGLSLFTDTNLEYKPLFILITIAGICLARWCAVFPLSNAINWVIRYKARRQGLEVAEELPTNWKIMIYWAGLRGAVGVALAAGLSGPSQNALKATVLVVVVLTVIIFGGTTSRMLEILHIRTGIVEEIDSDDEFDTEPIRPGLYARKNSMGFGHSPNHHHHMGNGGIGLDFVDNNDKTPRAAQRSGSYSTGNHASSPVPRPDSRSRSRDQSSTAEQGLLNPDVFASSPSNSDEEDNLDLPPPSTSAGRRTSPQPPLRPASAQEADTNNPYPTSGSRVNVSETWREWSPAGMTSTARGAIREIMNEDAGTVFRKFDEQFLKPHLLLDPANASHGNGRHGSGSGAGGPSGT